MCFTLEYSEVPNVDFADFNINLYIHSEKIHKWDQEKCSDFQNQIDFRKIDELKMLLIGFIHMRNKSPLSTAKSGNLSLGFFCEF
jgi:hypothetical protein